MSELDPRTLSGVTETSLITLYLRAEESQRPDALIKDEKAVELVSRMMADGPIHYDFDRMKLLHLSEANKLVIILRNRQIDRYAQDFLKRHPDGVVVHIGCGLDARFERIGCNQPNIGQGEWYDLDLPEVIELRRLLFGDEGERHHLLACSALEDVWLEAVKAPARLAEHRPRPFLFLAEGVFMYLQEEQVRSLVLMLRDHFPEAELVFDCYSPTHVWVHNFQIGTLGGVARAQWGVWHGQELEGWSAGIRLLDEWGPFERPEPRLARFRWWLYPFDWLFRTLRIYHFQLGSLAEGKDK